MEMTPQQKQAIAIASARLRLQQQAPAPDVQTPGDVQAASDLAYKHKTILQKADQRQNEFFGGAADMIAHPIDNVISPAIQAEMKWRNEMNSGHPLDALKSQFDTAKSQIQPLLTADRYIANKILPGKVDAPSGADVSQAFRGGGQAALMAVLGGVGDTFGGPLVNALTDKIPSTERAGANFGRVMAKAKDVPLDLTKANEAIARAQQLGGRGSRMPKVMSDYIRSQKPITADFAGTKVQMAQDPMTYEVGRDFASNAGKLSATEAMNTNGAMGAQVAKFADAMKTANREAAASVGMGELYDSAMKEYRQAKTLSGAADVLKKWTARAGLAAALGGFGKAGYDIYGKLTK